jgi:zona occludens toxin
VIYLYTGVPGAGKTLFALWDISRRGDFSSRPFFIAGMKPLTDVGHAKLRPAYIEPQDWASVPDGSIVLIDEAQFPMPVRPAGQVPPEWVAPLATHRHRGIDLYLTTQSPMLLDVFVRRLVGQHLHVNRVFGLRSVTVFRWENVQSDPNDYHAKKSAEVTPRRYPSVVFGWYNSATIHTHSRRLPKGKLALAGLAVSVIVGGLYGGFRIFERVRAPARPFVASAGSVSSAVQGGGVARPVARPAPVSSAADGGLSVPAAPRVSASGYTVRGSISRGSRVVYLAEDAAGDVLELSHCRVVDSVSFCSAGGLVVSVPGLVDRAGGQSVHMGASS